MIEFEGELIRPDGTGTWTYVNVPADAAELSGGKGQIRVKGTVNGVPFASSLMPHGDGRRYLVVNRAIRDAAGAAAGATVKVAMERDTEGRAASAPADLLAALADSPEGKAYFDSLAYSCRKEYVSWIQEAKRPETRASRIGKAVRMLAEGRKLK